MSIFDNIAKEFIEQFQAFPVIVRSPGRINIIGEHTDYNDGFVLPAAIDKAAYVAISLRTDGVVHLVAKDLNETFLTSVGDLKPVSTVSWPNYMLGIAAQFIKRGNAIPGFNAVLSSEVPIGAGLSSSAAVECATVFALNELLNTKLDRLTMVKMAQKAEHEYAGVMCGIMDQFASMMGKKDHVIMLDCRSLDYEYRPFLLDGYKILLLNTNVKHSLVSSEYNTIKKQCAQAVEWIQQHQPDVIALRDTNQVMLDEFVLPKNNNNNVIYKRSRFVVQEIERLLAGCQDLEQGNFKALGQKMFDTHFGLSNMYGVSCKELDWLVDYVKDNEGVIGARMMGGGFGGCTINLVKDEAIEPLIEKIKPAYEAAHERPLIYYKVSIENGTERLR
jgi:galactokinase